MLKVGIYTPYVRNEVTLAAVQFADWLVKCGIDVFMISDGKVEKGIHPVWDHQVKRGQKKAVYAWSHGATHLCWFNANPKALKWARLVSFDTPKIKTKHFFFPYWSHWPPSCDHFLMMADRVICLNKDLFDWLNRIRKPDKLLDTNRTWANLVAPDQVLVPKHGHISKEESYLMTVLTKTTTRDLGPQVLDVMDFLLNTHESLNITTVLENSLPRTYRHTINKLGKTYDNRIRYITSPPYYKYVELARKHDWVYLANTRHLNGSQLAALIPSSVPLICHDVPPAQAYVSNSSNGRLIPCKVHYESVPIAAVDMDVVGNVLDEVLNESSIVLKAIQLTGHEQYKQKQESFERFIYKEFVS